MLKDFRFDEDSRFIKHAAEVARLFIDNYRMMSQEARLVGTYNLMYLLRDANGRLEKAVFYYQNVIQDEYGLDYISLKSQFRDLKEEWEKLYDDKHCYKLNTSYLERQKESEALTWMLGFVDDVNKEITKLLEGLCSQFSEIKEFRDGLEKDDNIKNELLKAQYAKYKQSSECNETISHLADEVKTSVRLHGSVPEVYKEKKDTISHNAGVLFKCEEQKQNVAKYIFNRRCELTMFDLVTYFQHKLMTELLEERIKRFDYESTCDSNSNAAKLFETKAAEAFAQMCIGIIKETADITTNSRYAMVYLALKDMRVIKDGNNVAAFVQLLNGSILSENGENPISDATTLTKITKKFKNIPFKKLTKENIAKNNIEEHEFDRLSTDYHQSISIINLVLNIELEKKGFAKYLCTEHENTPNADIFSQFEDINVIGSVLRKEEPII